MPENSSCSSASSCSRESCEGCPSKANGGGGIAKEPMNPSSNVKKSHWSRQWKGRRRKIFRDSIPGNGNETGRIQSRYHGCGYYWSIHS